jgi:hypothetical protein
MAYPVERFSPVSVTLSHIHHPPAALAVQADGFDAECIDQQALRGVAWARPAIAQLKSRELLRTICTRRSSCSPEGDSIMIFCPEAVRRPW